MPNEILNVSPHPEGLLPAQEVLADLLFDTKTEAKVRRRLGAEADFSFETIVRPTSPIDFAQSGEFALKLHENHPDAPLSPFYINLRHLPPELLNQVGIAMASVHMKTNPDFCVGIPKAGDPLAEVYSLHTEIKQAELLRKEAEGDSRQIVSLNDTSVFGSVRLVDDLITQADTKLEAIKAIESLGLTVTDVVVLVDREQGGSDQLKRAGYNLHSVFTVNQLLDYYLRVGKIDKNRYQSTLSGIISLNSFLGI